MSNVMEKVQGSIEKNVVPVVNKLTSSYWFGIVANAVLYIVPFTMVSAIPSLFNVVRNFVPALPDLSALNTYSFGLVGMFIAFIIPHSVCVKEDDKGRALIAGFTGVGAFMLCMNPQTVDEGMAFEMWKFGSSGMFAAMAVGITVGAIYKFAAHHSFFGEESVIPDFVKSWFDSIIPILLSLTIAFLLTFLVRIDVFTVIALILSPVTSFGQSLPGVVFMALVMDVFYFFGVSGWAFISVTLPITQGGMAENMAAVAAGATPTNINAYGLSRYYMIGGELNTLPLAFMMLFSKSKKNRTLGKATFVPSLFNINEPLVFSTIVNNPYLFIPVILQAIILPANAYLWLQFDWASLHTQMFAMNFLPNAVSAYFLSNGDFRNVVLVVVNLILAAIISLRFSTNMPQRTSRKARLSALRRRRQNVSLVRQGRLQTFPRLLLRMVHPKKLCWQLQILQRRERTMSDAIDISAVAMEVILNTGDGRTCIDQALDSLAEFDFDAAEEHLAQADAKILTAHKVQTATIQAQAAGEEVEYSLLFTHAQDTLMTISAELHMVKKMMPIVRALAIRAGQ